MSDPVEREVTPQGLFERRREFLKSAGLFSATVALTGGGLWALSHGGRGGRRGLVGALDGGAPALAVAQRGHFVVPEPTSAFEDITTYNNFYELGLDKAEPAQRAGSLRLRPWTVEVGGLVAKPTTFDVEELLRWPLKERVYRMRCVEGWSMVVPWLGFPLAQLLERVQPLGSAKYVAFETLYDPQQLPGQRQAVLDWPYVEGLRLDEALHPLTLLAVGLYGQPLLGQNGAPLRLVVPWKYGFKGIKSIVRIALTEARPRTTWSLAAPREYGFFANVNPAVPHPRWSQATERRIGEYSRRPTLPFNGYADAVASLYAGLDPSTLY